MPATQTPFTVASHFAKSTALVRATYEAVLKVSREFGAVKEDPKKTSIHLLRETAFAGVAVQKSALILTLKADKPIESPRIQRLEQTSLNRWHIELRLASPDQIDSELRTLMAQAYELGTRNSR